MNAPPPDLRAALAAGACFVAACLGFGLALRLVGELVLIAVAAALGDALIAPAIGSE